MRVKPLLILLLIATVTAFIGYRALSVHDTGQLTTASALAGKMRKHPYYADALARGVVFVSPRTGYPGSWRYSFQLPSQFTPRMLAIEETELKREPDDDSFEHHVWKMASLLKGGTILNQRSSQVNGVEFTAFTVNAPQNFAQDDHP